MHDQIDIELVKLLQDDIEICSRPFGVIAKKLGISEDEAINRTQQLADNGEIRRFGALLNHRKAGFTNNAMVVWRVPDERISECGKIMSSFREVSHCYCRCILPSWPYNLYTMIHCQTKGECEKVVESISKNTGISNFEILYSIAELKKTSVKYFSESI